MRVLLFNRLVNPWYSVIASRLGSRNKFLPRGVCSPASVIKVNSWSQLLWTAPQRCLSNTASTPDTKAVPKVKLIYEGGSSKIVKYVKLFSLSTSIIGICLQPILFTHMAAGNIAFKFAMMTASSFFIVFTPLMLHFLCKRYVIRLYFNEETKIFTAVRYNLLAREKEFTFTPEEIELHVPSPFSNFKVKEQSFLLDSDKLRDTHPEVYITFMKYDKPLDMEEYFKRQRKE